MLILLDVTLLDTIDLVGAVIIITPSTSDRLNPYKIISYRVYGSRTLFSRSDQNSEIR